MLELDEIKSFYDKDKEQNSDSREEASNDTYFYWVTQWDDNILGDSNLAYKGEFNILRRAGRQISTDLRANPVQVDFQPKSESRDDGADLIDGLYRTDARVNTTIEAFDNASGEAVVCGVGAWELYTEYESSKLGNKNQVIRRRPILEANTTCIWDSNAKLLDKSDANRVTLLSAYSDDGYKELVKELTGREIDGTAISSFATPDDAGYFSLDTGNNTNIWVGNFYHREEIKDKVLTLTDPSGQELMLIESKLSEIMDELIDEGYEIVDSMEIMRWQVTKYIVSGDEILDSFEIAGEYLPVVPQYGERVFVGGEERWEGVTRLAKDPSRLRNFQMSYLADIVSRSPRPKPIFNPEQLQGFEFMYEENGVDNNYPYLLQNSKDASGNILPVGMVAQMPEQQVPVALMQSIQLSRDAVADVAPVNVSQDLADIDLSGKAMQQLQGRLDEQSMVYQEHRKHALRHDAVIYASMASDTYDAPRDVTITKPDGTRSKMSVMEVKQDRQTGEMVVLNDVTNMEFDVFAEIGASYTTKKEQTFDQLTALVAQNMQIDPPMAKMLMLKQTTLIDGVDMADVREYANKQLILGGFKEPETDEEIQMLQQSQQNKQPDANMALAMAEQAKADANMAEVQRKTVADQYKATTDQAKVEVSQFDAQTKRMAVQVDAQEANANINFKRIDAMTKRMDSMNKPQSFRASATAPVQ